MKKFKSTQPCIPITFCTEFSKAQVFPCEYRYFRESFGGKSQFENSQFFLNEAQHVNYIITNI